MNHEEKKVNAELSNRVQWVLKQVAQNHGSSDLSFNVLKFLSMSFSVKVLRNIGSLT